MTLTAEKLERRLNDLAEEASRNGGRFGKKKRTRRVEQLLVELAADDNSDDNYKTCASEVPVATWGEWMCDVVWWDSGKDGLLRSIPLVAESEWGNRPDVWDDFQKLLIIRAAVRVMIFCADSRDRASSLVEELKQQIQCFDSRQEGDSRYLFASHVDGESPPFSVKEYVFRRTS